MQFILHFYESLLKWQYFKLPFVVPFLLITERTHFFREAWPTSATTRLVGWVVGVTLATHNKKVKRNMNRPGQPPPMSLPLSWLPPPPHPQPPTPQTHQQGRRQARRRRLRHHIRYSIISLVKFFLRIFSLRPRKLIRKSVFALHWAQKQKHVQNKYRQRSE